MNNACNILSACSSTDWYFQKENKKNSIMNARKTLEATQFLNSLNTAPKKKNANYHSPETNNKINIAIFKLGAKRKPAGNTNE